MDTAEQAKQRVQMRKTSVGQFLWDKCGMDYYDTESAARRVAERAVAISDENVIRRNALERIAQARYYTNQTAESIARQALTTP